MNYFLTVELRVHFQLQYHFIVMQIIDYGRRVDVKYSTWFLDTLVDFWTDAKDSFNDNEVDWFDWVFICWGNFRG